MTRQAGKDSSLEDVLRVKSLSIVCDIVEKNKKVPNSLEVVAS